MFAISALTLLSIFMSSYAASLLTPTGVSFDTMQRRTSTSYVQAAYFTNWGIYGANFQPTDIDPSQLTHILYAFADVSPDTGEVFLTDSWADEEKHFPGDSWNEPGNNLYGCLKQLYLLKLSHRHLKVLLSVGGWIYSQDGHFSFLTNSDLRRAFVTSAIQLIRDYGFDGLDLDFEYPANEAEGQAFLELMTSMRGALDELATSNGDTILYELTAAVSAGSDGYAYYPFAQLDQVLTYWNLMAYDYAGSWLTYADYQDNLYGGAKTGISTDAAVKHYIASGATPGKLAIGMPLYGRAFENTDGIGDAYSGVGPGTLEAGVYSYKYLPLPGAHVFEDEVDVASYSYDPIKRELVSYDTPDIVRTKAGYVMSNGLAGCMFWELSADKVGVASLVQTAGITLGQLDQTPNHIHYPHSKWDNIRNNMGTQATPGPNSVPTSLSPSTTTNATAMTTATATARMTTTGAMTTTTPVSTAPLMSCLCDGVASWNATVVYVGGDEALYDGYLWTAKWWTENDAPGGLGVWVDEGACV